MPFDRRTLLKSTGAALALSPLACKDDPPKATPETAAPNEERAAPSSRIAPMVMETLAAVAERILPSEGEGPGAREADVARAIERTLTDPRMKNLVPLMNRASGFLVRYAQSEKGQKSFAALTDVEKDEILTRLVENKVRPDGFSGTAFMQVMVALTLEGFLGDPRHGGNKDRVAWQWLGYDENGGRAAVFGGG